LGRQEKEESMRVLLIQPAPPSDAFGDSLPIGLACIATYLRGAGVETRMIDLGKQPFPSDFVPDVVGIGASTPYAPGAISCSEEARRRFPRATIVFGGHHFAALPQDAFPYADVVVRGEGETAMLDICRNGVTERIVDGTPLASLDDIPVPDGDVLDCVYAGRAARLHIVGARGCPFSCTFCAEHARVVRCQSPERFVAELEVIADRYHNDILISDDIFTINKSRSTEVCERILRKGLNLRLQVFGHVRSFDRELLLLMKRAGVHTVSFGIESGNNGVLRQINKHFTIEQAEETVRKTAEAGLTVNCLYMVGNVGETPTTLADTVRVARRLSDVRWCSYALPFPGTHFYDVCEGHGTLLTRDWENYRNDTIVYVPRTLTAEEMRQARETILRRSPAFATAG
jgi:anaerobic magnesium-protoporphyrin IX monomethyl ester cyclase